MKCRILNPLYNEIHLNRLKKTSIRELRIQKVISCTFLVVHFLVTCNIVDLVEDVDMENGRILYRTPEKLKLLHQYSDPF